MGQDILKNFEPSERLRRKAVAAGAAIAGLGASMGILYPADTIKVRIQSGSLAPPAPRNLGISAAETLALDSGTKKALASGTGTLAALRAIVAEEGVLSLYAGFLPAVTGYTLQAALRFGTYDIVNKRIRGWMARCSGGDSGGMGRSEGWVRDAARSSLGPGDVDNCQGDDDAMRCGSRVALRSDADGDGDVGGSGSTWRSTTQATTPAARTMPAAATPATAARTRTPALPLPPPTPPATTATTSVIITRTLTPTTETTAAAKMPTTTTRCRETDHGVGCQVDLGRAEQWAPLAHLGAACVAELAASFLRVPSEVVKQRLQVRSYAGPRQAIAALSHGGLKSFYVGYAPYLTRSVPYTAIQFLVYEQLRRSSSGKLAALATHVAAAFSATSATLVTFMVNASLARGHPPLGKGAGGKAFEAESRGGEAPQDEGGMARQGKGVGGAPISDVHEYSGGSSSRGAGLALDARRDGGSTRSTQGGGRGVRSAGAAVTSGSTAVPSWPMTELPSVTTGVRTQTGTSSSNGVKWAGGSGAATEIHGADGQAHDHSLHGEAERPSMGLHVYEHKRNGLTDYSINISTSSSRPESRSPDLRRTATGSDGGGGGQMPAAPLSGLEHCLFGLIAGGIAAAATNPIDVVMTREITGVWAYGRRGMLGACLELLRHEGVPGLMSGASARVLSLAPASAILFTVYEVTKRILGEPVGPPGSLGR